MFQAKRVDLAKKYSVERIELCQNLEIGGTTPSHGLVEYALELGLETHVLVRPRMGGFVYTEDEYEIMFKDARLFKALGVEGLVVGF